MNLASREYSICVCRYLPEHVRFISCVFGEEKEGRIIEKGTMITGAARMEKRAKPWVDFCSRS